MGVCIRVISEPRVTANIQTLVGTGQDKVPGWWHPGEVKGLGW